MLNIGYYLLVSLHFSGMVACFSIEESRYPHCHRDDVAGERKTRVSKIKGPCRTVRGMYVAPGDVRVSPLSPFLVQIVKRTKVAQ
jgi:hypothetical protein